METIGIRRIDWGATTRTRAGETDSGDRCLVVPTPDGALLAAVDGLGHGPGAALAADLAVRIMEKNPGRPLPEIVEHCHQMLVRTRGVALSLASWDARTRFLTWVGVGNVEGLLIQAGGRSSSHPERLLLRRGIVGVRLPPLQAAQVGIPGYGVLIFATDGVTVGFDRWLPAGGPAQSMADHIMARYCRESDDALVLVACLG